MRSAVSLILLLAVLGVRAAAPDDEAARLAAQRRAVEQRFAAEQAECAGRFAVTSCMEQARLKRRDALAALQKREAALEQRDRLAAAARRRAAIAARAASAPARPAEAASAPASAAKRAARPRPAPEPIEALPPPAAGHTDRQAREHRARVANEQRQRAAAEHRKKVEERNAARAARGLKPAAPLPAPASGAAK